MGNIREYIQSGGFSQYLYKQVGDIITASNGIQGKKIIQIDNNNGHYSLPIHSNHSNIYFKQNDSTGEIEQARVYVNRLAAFDFDWGHVHDNFPIGIVHVQSWRKNKHGAWIRDSKSARYMTDEEIHKYGELLKLASPNIKFRP